MLFRITLDEYVCSFSNTLNPIELPLIYLGRIPSRKAMTFDVKQQQIFSPTFYSTVSNAFCICQAHRTHTLFFDYVETIFWLISKVATCCYPTYTTRNSSFINQRHFRKKGSLTCICHGWHSIAIASDVVDIAAGLGSFAAAMIYAWFLYSFVVDAYFALEPIVFKWCW